MLYRRTRTHHTGSSNLVPRLEAYEVDYRQSRLQRHSTESDTLIRPRSLSRRANTEISPFEKTEQFYEHTGRSLKIKPEISVPRTAHLEDKDKRKNVFTGESFIAYDGNIENYSRPKSLDTAKQQAISRKEHIAKHKRDIHATAIQETQLIGYDKHSVGNTLKNNVNLEKVREAKRILRRRYANKTNIHKIHAAWDEERSGTVSVDNVYNMCKRLGLNLNMDEAKVLLASANKTGKGYLELDEFYDMIYNKDDALNSDIKSISKNIDANYLVKRDELYKDEGGVIKNLEIDAKKKRENKRLNQINLILKSKLNRIINDFKKCDPNNYGHVNQTVFEDALKRLEINNDIVSQEDINAMAKTYTNDNLKIDYKGFIEGLRNFKFEFDELYKEYKQPRSKSTASFVPTLDQGLPESQRNFSIVDSRDLPLNMMDNYLGKRRKVTVALKRFFPTKNEFKSHVSKCLKVEADQVDDQPISQHGIKDIVYGIFDQLDMAFLKKRDFEGFISSFLYNKHGFTKVKDLSRAIYEEPEEEYYEKITRKNRGPPPHAEISGVNNNERKSIPTQPTQPNNDVDLETNLKAQRARSASRFVNRSQIKSNGKDEGLTQILQKIDNQILVWTMKSFERFKHFDTDKDGFISHKDFRNKIDGYAVLQQAEISKLIEYLDPENKGYVTFKEFNSKIRPNMTQQDEQGEPIVLPSVMPSRKFNNRIVPKLKEYKVQVEDATKTFEGSYAAEVPTRFSSTPGWVNTFLNFQPPSDSGMFMPETERLLRDKDGKTGFQKEDQVKRASISVSRIESLRANQKQLQAKIDQEILKQDKTIEANMKKKSMENMLFEKRVKDRSGFAF